MCGMFETPPHARDHALQLLFSCGDLAASLCSAVEDTVALLSVRRSWHIMCAWCAWSTFR